MNNTIAMAVFAVFIFILLGIIVFLAMKLRSGKKEIAYSSDNLDDDVVATDDGLQPIPELPTENTATPNTHDNSIMSSVAELLSEGHETKAIAMLNSAIASQPNHSKFHMMLLNIYAKNNDTANFEKAVDALHIHGDVAAIAKANQLRNQLQPINTEFDIDELRNKSASQQTPSAPATESNDLAFGNELDDIFNDSSNSKVSDLDLDNNLSTDDSVLSTLNENTANNLEVTSDEVGISKTNSDDEYLTLDSALNDDLSISQQLSAIESTIVNSKALDNSMLDEVKPTADISNDIQSPQQSVNTNVAKSEDDFFSLDFEDSDINQADTNISVQTSSEDTSIDFFDSPTSNQSLSPNIATPSTETAENLATEKSTTPDENLLDFSFDIDNKKPSQPVIEDSLSLESTESKADEGLSFDFDTSSVPTKDNAVLNEHSSDDFSSFELSLDTDVDTPLTNDTNSSSLNSVANDDAGFDFELSLEPESSNPESSIADNSVEFNPANSLEQNTVQQGSQNNQGSQDNNSIDFNLNDLSNKPISDNILSNNAVSASTDNNSIDLDFGAELDALSLDSSAGTTQDQNVSSTESLAADFNAGLDIQLTDNQTHQVASNQSTPENTNSGIELVEELNLTGVASDTKDVSLELEAFSLADGTAVTDDINANALDKPVSNESIEPKEFDFDAHLDIENTASSVNIEPEVQNLAADNLSQKDNATVETDAVQAISNEEFNFDIETPDNLETNLQTNLEIADKATFAPATNELSINEDLSENTTIPASSNTSLNEAKIDEFDFGVDTDISNEDKSTLILQDSDISTPNDTFSFDDDTSTHRLENAVTEPNTIAQPALEEPAVDIQTPVAATAEDSALLSKIKTEFSVLDSIDSSQTNLELASSYLQLGEFAGAKVLLTEVISSGNADQQAKANDLLSKLSA